MTIANAMKEFFYKLNGSKPAGMTIADVILNGAANVECNNESALTARVTALEGADNVEYEDATNKSFVLNSSTEDSVKRFRITVVDAGTISATEIDTNGDPVVSP